MRYYKCKTSGHIFEPNQAKKKKSLHKNSRTHFKILATAWMFILDL